MAAEFLKGNIKDDHMQSAQILFSDYSDSKIEKYRGSTLATNPTNAEASPKLFSLVLSLSELCSQLSM